MNKDLIAANFTDGVNKILVKRYISLIFILIILFLIFTMLNFTDWYLAIRKAIVVKQTLLSTFHYKVQPVFVVIEASLSALALNYFLKGNKSILLSFEHEQPDLLNKGYQWLHTALVLNIAGYVMLTISLLFRMYLVYKT